MDFQMTTEQAMRFHYIEHQNELVIWVITEHPKDFPDWFVARPVVCPAESAVRSDGHLKAKTLEELRRLLPMNLTCLARYPDDDLVILEAWL